MATRVMHSIFLSVNFLIYIMGMRLASLLFPPAVAMGIKEQESAVWVTAVHMDNDHLLGCKEGASLGSREEYPGQQK